MMKVRLFFFVLLVGLFFFAKSGYAIDFYGANVIDSDVTSSYFKIGLFGFRPIVDNVIADSPAAKHGLQRGDIIVLINGKDIKRSSELNKFTTDALSVSVYRGREKIRLTIDMPAIQMLKTKPTATEKQSIAQRQSRQDVPAKVVNSSPVKPDERKVISPASVRSEVKPSGPVISRDASYLDNQLPTKSNPNVPAEVVRSQDLPHRQKSPAKGDIFSRPIKPAQDVIIFENSKGDVKFSHSVHLKSLDKEQCMLCHRMGNSVNDSIKSRINNPRAAHGFCRGCHQKIGNAPTSVCQVCHK